MARRRADNSERKRRQQQSARDKASAKAAKQPAKRSRPRATAKSTANARGNARRSLTQSASGSSRSIEPYTKLTLDPCHAKLSPTPLPGRDGSSLFRLPFRQVVTCPSTSVALSGSPWVFTSGGTAVNNTCLIASLVPHAMSTQGNTGGVFALNIVATATESTTPWSTAQVSANAGFVLTNETMQFDPSGLQILNGIDSLIRPVAACVKLEFYAGSNNSGSFFGWEGPCGQMFAPYFFNGQSGPNGYYPQVSGSQLAMNGWSSGIVTEGVEAAVNFASTTQQWQEFRSLSNVGTVGGSDAIDQDFSQMPISAVGVGGATPGTQYLVSGAIVYEWVPSIQLGVGGGGSAVPPERNSSILSKVATQLAEYGPMLVGVASKLVTGGPSLALSDLFYRLSMNQNNIQGTGARAQIAWR